MVGSRSSRLVRPNATTERDLLNRAQHTEHIQNQLQNCMEYLLLSPIQAIRKTENGHSTIRGTL